MLYPQLEEYEYANSKQYREHHIDKMVRYLAVLTPAERLSVRFARFSSARLLSTRARTVPARVAAGHPLAA